MLKSLDMADMQDMPEQETQAEENTDPGNGNNRLVLWLVVMSMSFAVIPLFLTGGVIDEERQALEAELGAIQAELNATPIIDPEVERLESELIELRNNTSVLDDLEGSLIDTDIDWTALMQTFIGYDPAHMELTTITQEARRVVVSGRADDESDLMSYVDVLQESNLFAQVILQSINRNPPETDEDGNPLPNYRLVEFVIQIDLEDTTP